MLLVLTGDTELTVLGEAPRHLHTGDMAIVPSGRCHRNDAPSGVTVFHLTPNRRQPALPVNIPSQPLPQDGRKPGD